MAEEGTGLLRRRGQRLATLAALARPVQHDLNNLLTVVFANLEMLKRSAAAGAPQRQLDRVEQAARRFEATTRAILSLSRRPVPEEAPVPLAKALAELQPLLAMLLPAPGALTFDLADTGWAACLDRAALEEGLLGLVLALAEQPTPAGGQRIGLGIAVADRPGSGVGAAADGVGLILRLAPPEAAEAPPVAAALDALRAIAGAAGGTAACARTAEAATLSLHLPRHLEGPAPG